MKTYSLSNRLTRWISIPTLLASAITLTIGFLFAWHEIEEVYDAEMVHTAKIMLQIANYEIKEHHNINIALGREDSRLQHRYEKYITYRIWHKGNLVSRAWKTDVFGDFEPPRGFSDQHFGNHDWRFFVFVSERDEIKIEVAQRYSIRYELSGQLMSSLILPGLIFIPTVILIVLISVRKSLQPMVKISQTVDQRNSDDLSPLRNEYIPEEISPLIQALNRLLERLENSFKREREFTDHAAHELRTPLAAMKTQTQVLLRESQALPEMESGLNNLHMSINRATHLIEQLLYFSRLQNEKLPLSRMCLSETLEDSVARVSHLAREKQQILTVNIAHDVDVIGHNDAVDIMLANLLDNAVKYSPKNSEIKVSLDERGKLSIADSGPGLNDEDKQRVFQRFVRVDKTGQKGSGLGLSIVSWIATIHECKLELLDNSPQGLLVIIHWQVQPSTGPQRQRIPHSSQILNA